MQLGLISTWTLDVVIETSLVSPVETKQVRKIVVYIQYKIAVKNIHVINLKVNHVELLLGNNFL